MTIRRFLFAAAIAVAFAAGLAVAQFAFDGADAHRDPEADIRVQARVLENGRFEVAVQQRGSGGEWGGRRLPELRILDPAAPAGRWFNSSPLSAVAGDAEQPLFCVIGHGHLDDYFWGVLRSYSNRAARDLDADVRFETHLDSAGHAAAIRQCSADGAAVIASSLVDPEAMVPALQEASAAGARIITFNSGGEFADRAGSELHIAMDDRAAGRIAAEQFNAAGLSGAIACLLHEADNSGLDDRCAGLDETYEGGDVERVQLPVEADAEGITGHIAGLLAANDPPAGLLALNSDTALAALEAISRTRERLDYEPQLGSIGGHPQFGRLPLDLRNDHLLFLTNDLGPVQGYLITAALRMVHEFHLPASFIVGTSILEAEPFIFNSRLHRADDQGATSQGVVDASDAVHRGENE